MIDFPPLTERQKAELEALNSMSDSDIDYSDLRKQTAQDFERGHFYYTTSFTTERIAELRKNINLSDIPEIKDFSGGYLRNL